MMNDDDDCWRCHDDELRSQRTLPLIVGLDDSIYVSMYIACIYSDRPWESEDDRIG